MELGIAARGSVAADRFPFVFGFGVSESAGTTMKTEAAYVPERARESGLKYRFGRYVEFRSGVRLYSEGRASAHQI